MCDTFICPPSQSAQGTWIFGKNSDREPDEAQVIRYFPREKKASRVQPCTFIPVEHVPDTYSVLLSKPDHIWGAEMGINEHGVVIGNEAVFTRIPIPRTNKGLTGMDMLRLALESAQTAREALEKLKWLNDRYGQDACGGYRDRRFFYHNSFIIADPTEAFVLETAGPFWAVEYVKSYRAISNGLSIGAEYDEIHPGTIACAQEKGWSEKGKPFHFADSFNAFWMPRLARCRQRRQLSEQSARQKLTVADAFDILRTHAEEGFKPSRGTTGSICMHASGLFSPHQTTGSMVAELGKGRPPVVWITGSSAPCLSIYTPFSLDESAFVDPEITGYLYRKWWKWETWHRKAILDYSAAHQKMQEIRPALENRWRRTADAHCRSGDTAALVTLQKEALAASDSVLNDLLKLPLQKRAPWLYRRLWKGTPIFTG